MATTLGDLLDVLGDEATLRTDTIDPLDFVDADRALALLGRTLQRLVDDGLTTGGGTDRERWVGEAARASAGGAAAIAARPGRLAQLAGAADDVVALMRESLGCAQRWAIATAVVDVVGRLTALAERGDITDGRRRTLIVADASAIVVQRSAALDPPSALDSIPLDCAVPRPSPHSTAQLAVVVTEVVAGLEHATRPVGEPIPIADYLAVCTALEALSRSADHSWLGGEPPLKQAARHAGQGWAAARAVLNPFDDGSRRPHLVAPLAVGHALQLHTALGCAAASFALNAISVEAAGSLTTAVCEALQRVPIISDHLEGALTGWAATRSALAYARDLEPRDTRVTEYLAGFHRSGLVRPDPVDLAPARSALNRARLLSVELATRAAPPTWSRSNVARLAAANRSERIAVTDEHVHSAALEARRALLAYAGPPRGGRGPSR